MGRGLDAEGGVVSPATLLEEIQREGGDRERGHEGGEQAQVQLPNDDLVLKRGEVEEWIASCISYLISQIYIVKPKVIITLGADATNALLGLPLDTKIGGLRGQVQNYSDEVFVIPTYHPSYLLRGGGEQHKHFDIVVGDFSLACITAEKNL